IPYPPDRFVNLSFIIFAQIPLLGYSLYIVLLSKGYATGLGATILVLGFLWTLGFFSCFSSPYAGGISEAIPQNEVEGMQWLIESKAAYPYVMSAEEYNAEESKRDVDPEIYFVGKESNALSEISSRRQPVPANGFKDVKSLEASTNEPFYLVVTTFSEALGLEKSAESYKSYLSVMDNSSVGNGSESQDNKPLYKIYDSLNIRIYKHIS
ncbi:MAG TPA: hypothetical protein HA306_10800, partial [Methanosarcina sp.]|nr:hypothetical protein [Methanosarcina sp.]